MNQRWFGFCSGYAITRCLLGIECSGWSGTVVLSVWDGDLRFNGNVLTWAIMVVIVDLPTPLCFVSAWRKGVASAQRSGLTSEEARGSVRGLR